MIEGTVNQVGASEPDADELLRWYVVRAYSGAEWQLRSGLLRRGIEAFLPWYIGEFRRGRWTRGVVRPSFPGYLFAGLEPDQDTKQILDTPGALAVIKTGDQVVEVTAKQIAKIRQQAAEDYMESLGVKVPQKQVKVGDWVAVPQGRKMAGTPVEVDAIDKHGRIKASLGPFRVEFPLSEVTEVCTRKCEAIP